MTKLLLTALSALLVLAGFLALRKTKPSLIYASVFSAIAIASLTLLVAQVVASQFTGNGIDEATLYHLKYGLTGAGFFEYRWLIGTAAVALLAIAYVSIRFVFNTRRTEDTGLRASFLLLPLILISLSLLFNPSVADLYALRSSPLISKSPVGAEIANSFYEYYRKPQLSPATADQKNLVFIYAESLERSYFDQEVFPGLAPGLRALESSSTYFTNIRQVTGTAWTVAGMTASQCGIPLVTPSHGNSMSGMDEFLSSAVCLGDLLGEQGYKLSYMGGASTEFAGKGKLLKTHGFSEVLGREELLPRLADPSYKTGWGLFDDSLFDLSYQKFTELSESGEKFGLFTLTLDTHHPQGHPSKDCSGTEYADGENPILNAVACSDLLISNFVKRIADSPYADETVIVIVSDHLALWNTAHRQLQTTDRRNLFMIIEPGRNESSDIQTLGSTLDIGATILPFLGYSGEIGLGRNLLSASEAADDRSFIHANLENWSQALTSFWDFPRIRRLLAIDPQTRRVSIDRRIQRLPILIELDDKLQSTLRFEFDSSSSHKSLLEQRNELDSEGYFLLIDECRDVFEIDNSLGQDGYCLISGQGAENRITRKLDTEIAFTANELRREFGLSNGFEVHRVAHAGGGIDEQTYTNSFEALDFNLARGFKYFEIDFSFTSDEQLVCLHDWGDSFKHAFGLEPKGSVTLEEFESLVRNKSALQLCTAASLASWMHDHPGTFVVTDVKERNLDALRMMLQSFPDASRRVIPQVYDPENLAAVRKLGFENVIWTLYKFRRSNAEVLEWAERFRENIAITMPKTRAESDLPERLGELLIPTYVHTVNSAQEEELYINEHLVTELYTDFLQP